MKTATPTPSAPASSRQEADVFRDYIPTVSKQGRRIWLYPMKPSGRFTRARTWVSAVLLLFLFAGPFLRINGNPVLMFNIVERKFSLLGQMFYPQDNYLFALAMVTVFVMLVLFTAIFGRIWCGWLCPQTILMEMVFRKIEHAIEGDGARQKAFDNGPWDFNKIWRKTLKHTIFFGISFLIGNLLLAFVIGSEALIEIITSPISEHSQGFIAMVLFTLLFYGIFARFREQACTFVCPYGRMQSVLIDDNSLVVSYDWRRGDNRAKWNKSQTIEERRAAGIGDCIDCKKCVAVCPTGIDIRNGTPQMECVNCTACIDACDSIMDRLKLPQGLIRYASKNNIEQGTKFRLFTPRIGLYLGVLAIVGGLLTYLLITRADVDATLLRPPGSMPQLGADGTVINIYSVRFTNKTRAEKTVELRLERKEGEARFVSGLFIAPPQDQTETTAIVTIPAQVLSDLVTPIQIGVYEQGKKIHTIRTTFTRTRNTP